MISDALRKSRDVLSIGLLCVAVLYVLSGLSLLFKSQDDSGYDFSGRAAVDGHLFTSPFVALAIAGAALFAVGLGGPSRLARPIVLAAVGIGGVALLFGVISWLAGFGASQPASSLMWGVLAAGKIVAFFLGLAELGFLAAAFVVALSCLRVLPAPAKATAPQPGWEAQTYAGWGQPGQPGPPGQPGQPGMPGQPGTAGQPGMPGQPGYAGQPSAAGHPGVGQPSPYAGPAQQAPTAYPPPGGYGAPVQGWGPPGQQQAWGAAASGSPWPQPTAERPGWPPQQSWEQAAQTEQRWPEAASTAQMWTSPTPDQQEYAGSSSPTSSPTSSAEGAAEVGQTSGAVPQAQPAPGEWQPSEWTAPPPGTESGYVERTSEDGATEPSEPAAEQLTQQAAGASAAGASHAAADHEADDEQDGDGGQPGPWWQPPSR